MKILQVIPSFNPQRGGDINSCYNLSKYLAKKGHSVTILTTDFEFDKKYAESLENQDVTVITFHCIMNLSMFLFSPSIRKWLKDHIKEYEIVHLHNFRSYQNAMVHLYATKNHLPVILHARGDLPFYEKSGLKTLYDIVWGKRILNGVTKAIALTKTETEEYKKMGVAEDRIVIIPNGVDLSLFDHLPAKGTFRAKYEIPPDAKIVLFLGRLHKIKGLHLLIDAFSEVQKDVPVSKLVIVGPDEGCLQTLQRQVETLDVGRDVIFTGPLYGQEKFAAYVDADVYVLPSVYEAFPNTVLEAWACGTPVIVAKGCCISDIVENAGHLVNYDKNDLKNTIVKVFNNKEGTGRFQENGKRLIEQTLNIDVFINKIEELYYSLIHKNHINNKGE